ncbi:MAG: hypothetical protein ACOCV2_11760 [Persicimonas sp.]
MEFRCKNCTHVGVASEVRQKEGGVMLVCANCGHENVLDVAASEAGEAEEDPGADSSQNESSVDGASGSLDDEALARRLEQVSFDGETSSDRDEQLDFGDKAQVRQWLREDALESLIPEEGDGPRCRKCAHLLEPEFDNCPRCGLDRDEAEQFAPGQAPWETPPEGKEAEQEQAELLWEAFRETGASDDLDKFVRVVREEELLDFAIRKLRFYLADHREHEGALSALRDLAGSLQSKLIVARARAQHSADAFQEDVGRFKRRLIGFTVVFWAGVLLLFVTMFWDNCSGGPPQL